MTTDTTSAPILITAGTGKTGRRITRLLTADGHLVRPGSRGSDPALDWTDPTTWPAVLDGVERAYLCYSPDLSFPGSAEVMGAFAQAAVAAGVRRAVLLSGRGEPLAQLAEEAVDASGLALTVVRSSWIAQNFSEDFLVEGVRHGRFALPSPGAHGEGIVDADDLAEVIVAALLDDRLVGRTLEVTGPRLLTPSEMADVLTAATGHRVVYDALTPEDFQAELEATGLPASLAGLYTELFAAIMDGRNAVVRDDVQQVLGRPPRDFADYARAVAGTGVWEVPAEVGV